MIQSIKIAGFKNFRGKSVELKDLKRINLLVGINGSGKSSLLELLMGVSQLSQLNGEMQDIAVGALAPRLHSLFEPKTQITFSYDTTPNTYQLEITTQAGSNWQVKKTGQPAGGTNVVALVKSDSTPFNSPPANSTIRARHPFAGIRPFAKDKHIVLPDLDRANSIIAKSNPSQRHLRMMSLSSGQFTFEDDNEVQTEFLAGGSRYIAGLIAAVREMRNSKPLLLVDDLGDELFPAIRKRLIPELNSLIDEHPEPQFSQVFASTHNIEVVKSALDHPEYCSVYMFNYDGSLLEFRGTQQYSTTVSKGVKSSHAVSAIAKMLGLEDLDLGFPEIVLLAEEETKKTFLEALTTNAQVRDELRKFEVHVPFQNGDGNTTKAIHNMLDLSKYLFFSEVWAERYVIFVDHNGTDYHADGTAKSDSTRQMALLQAQKKLGLGKRFLLTKDGDQYTPSLEDTYPKNFWKQYKNKKGTEQDTFQSFLDMEVDKTNRGKTKNEFAKFVGSSITLREFKQSYSELAQLLLKDQVLPSIDPTPTLPPIKNPPESDDDMYDDALRVVIESNKASTSLLQRRLRVGYARAARLIEQLEADGIIGPADGSLPRKVLTLENIEEM